MKLLAKYNRINILATLLVLFASGICYYFIIHYVLVHQLDKDLKVEEQEINAFVKTNGKLPDPSTYKDQQTSFRQTGNEIIKRRFLSIDVFEKDEKEFIPQRMIVFPLTVNGKQFEISISKSQGETEDLIKLVLVITLAIMLILLFVLFIINRLILSKLWLPFQRTVSEVQQFNLSNKKKLELDATNINEFTDLNNAVQSMADRVKKDYTLLKNFTENASHEIQTPLAIINSKLDLLLQDEHLSEQQMVQMQGMYNALDRLSKLNQSLLLLAKIDNQQFSNNQPINVELLIEEKCQQFEEMLSAKYLAIKKNFQPCNLVFNKQLMEILFGNLLANAIRYTQPSGQLLIQLDQEKLTVANTSLIPELDKNQVFQRFYRHSNTQQEGNGLGLSIVKQICEIGGFSIEYQYIEGFHRFIIQF